MRRGRARAVGVIGLGIKGGAMARNQVRRGFDVTGYDPDPKRRREAARAGIAGTVPAKKVRPGAA
ncbi:MAG: hypothetical protein FJX46_13095 [Alphaproteobacteria bacterium]|nr:hypothetical protein [Alphaproteobacteria bacterium]